MFLIEIPSYKLNIVIVTIMVNMLTNKDECCYYDSTFLHIFMYLANLR